MTDQTKMISLRQLKRSTINVRKTGRLIGIPDLATDIANKGLLENLVVRPAGTGKDRSYEVTAGGRRLAALQFLAKRKKIARDYPVRCLVRKDDVGDAVEVSLAENFFRVDLHPADQFDAFASITKEGRSVDDIAARYGVTPTFVQQRLKLAGVSPRLVQVYRAGSMTLEQLTAFTVSNDHAAQEEAWFNGPYTNMPAHLIKRQLTKAHVAGTDRRARFVGRSAYTAAGGAIVSDLFQAKDEGYFEDSQLLDRLVAEKLDAAAASVRAEGWQWVEVLPDPDHAYLNRFESAQRSVVKLGKADRQRLAVLSARHDELVEECEQDTGFQGQGELDAIAAEIEALQVKTIKWPEAEKTRAGAVLSIGTDGTLETFRGLLRPNPNERRAARARKAKDDPASGGYSDAVRLDLSAYRTAALREAIAAKPAVALQTLLHAIASRLIYSASTGSCLGVTATEVALDRASASVADGKAANAAAQRQAFWSKRLPKDQSLLWDELLQMNKGDCMELLAHCVALTINALSGSNGRDGGTDDADRLAAAVGLDMASWWRPTHANFFHRLTKNEILAAVSEGSSPQAAERLADLKKAEMGSEAEKLLANNRWLPIPLRPPNTLTPI